MAFKSDNPNIPYRLILVFSLLAACIGLAGYAYYNNQKEHVIEEKRNELSAIADLKVAQISEWREARIADGNAIYDNRLISQSIRQSFEKPHDLSVGNDVVAWLNSLREHYRYKPVLLFDAKGDLRRAIPNDLHVVESHVRPMIEEAIRSRKVIVSDFHREGDTGHIHLSVISPVLTASESGTDTVGVILLEIDPNQFIFPFIQSWPTPSPSAETLLVRREGGEVVYLNELRHKKNTALIFRIPVAREAVPAAMAVLGRVGIVEGIDYRGIPVIAATRPVPNSPWFLVAKIDKEELYAPIRKRSWYVSAVVLTSIIAAGLSVVLWWRQQRIIYYRRLYETEKQSIEELRQSETALRKTLTELERSNSELEQFAYIASHDLQEPLRMVSSYVQLIEREYGGKLGGEADEYIGFAVEGATRMQKMINDLLAYSRIETRGRPFEPTDCEEVLRTAIANLKVAIEESGALVSHDPLPTIKADGSQLVQLLQNLVGNSIKFRGNEPPRIHLAAVRRDGDWLFSVSDNGIGIDSRFRERIFLVFQRLHTRRKYPGTGIGLSICKRVVVRHGGEIWVESEPGKGSIFYFTIPDAREPEIMKEAMA
ncbi:MAG: hypothetical protein HZA20_08320 [Nitrospirae bacterium]|nr:hypothetical protein [Nitrospirota bacterium]